MIRTTFSARSGGGAGGLFIDRDGVLNHRVQDGYVLRADELRVLDHALPAIRAARCVGALVVVVTNQGCVGRRLLDEAGLALIHASLVREIEARGGAIDAVYACPHHPLAPDPADRSCECRKPRAGLLLAAAGDLDISLERSVMIGDQASDIHAGLASGMRAENVLLVDDGALGQKVASALGLEARR